MIRRSQRLGVTTEKVECNEVSMLEFANGYREAMGRLHADPEYFFPDSYFIDLRALAPENLFLVHAKREGSPVAMALFLAGPSGMHYHLSARLSDDSTPGSVNAILHAAVVSAQELGLSSLHLGGGATRSPIDPLFSFKRSMGTTCHASYIGTRIHNQEKWQEARDIWESRTSHPENLVKLLGYHDEP